MSKYVVTEKQAMDRAAFFYNYFYGMNFIYRVRLLSNADFEEYLKCESEESQIFFRRTTDVNGCFSHVDEGMGYPGEAEIIINKKRCTDINKFNSTLIHELTHCAMWWQGLDFDDGEKQFEDRLKELGLPSNYDIAWKGRGTSAKVYKKEGDQDKLDKYEAAYQEHLKEVCK